MATDDTGFPKDPSSEKLKQSSNIVLQQSSDKVMATDHARISIDVSVKGQSDSSTQVMATDDTGFPKDPSSEKLKQSSNIVLQQSSNKVRATDNVRISIVVPVEGQSDSSTHTQPQESLVGDLIQISEASSKQNSWKISKVPPRLRRVNEKFYEPRVISIGPYNYGKKHLKGMEIIKKRSLSRILKNSEARANEFVKAMQAMEKDVREHYSEDFDRIDCDKFVKMMIIDGCFIVDLFQNNHQRKEFWERDGILTDIYYDLLLLENQLPFSVLSKLYGIITMSNVETDEFARLAQMDEFARLVLSRLENLVPGLVNVPKKFPENIKDLLEIKHLLGLIHDSWIPPLERVQCQETKTTTSGVQGQETNITTPRLCARELKDAGIKFVKKDNDVENHIYFTDDAILKIPTLNIDYNTELILRNFMAFEQSILSWEPMYVCDYVVFMNELIKSGKDVQLLHHSGIIVHSLDDDEAVARMFNKLRVSIYTSEVSFCYKKIYDAVDKHCQRKLNKWRAKILKKVRCFISIITCRQAGK